MSLISGDDPYSNSTKDFRTLFNHDYVVKSRGIIRDRARYWENTRPHMNGGKVIWLVAPISPAWIGELVI